MTVTLLSLLALLTTQQETPPRLVAGSISNDDYPAEAIQAGESGTVAATLTISAEGRVTDCRVTASSGSAALDSSTCRAAIERYVFEPARNSQGIPVASTYAHRVRWQLPEESQGPFRAFNVVVTARVHDGQLLDCSVGPVGVPRSRLPACDEWFGQSTEWARRRDDVEDLTQLIAFAPEGSAPVQADPAWGPIVVLARALVTIDVEGRIAGCDRFPDHIAADARGVSTGDPCSLSGGRGRPAFEPAVNGAARRGEVVIATFANRSLRP